ncbi:hypothetical protein DM01DRAFT_1345108 [Hesseltinella vesiculosa]|uniref:Uncharacterized protein n=1 Tax=Hesseltinella vesiculosa TaxID=101127 RepID=A0A1X2GJU2_9FUNG|nr:hypothetical protein DM01DRAFT_1345108 [Hesseltinella vesiculosa]
MVRCVAAASSLSLFRCSLARKHPTFAKFITTHEEDLARWSLRQNVSDAQEFHNLWSSRYGQGLLEFKPHKIPERIKFNAKMWESIVKYKANMVSVDVNLTSNALRAVGAYSWKAGDILESTAQESVKRLHNDDLVRPTAKRHQLSNSKKEDQHKKQSDDDVNQVLSRRLAHKQWTDNEKRLLEELIDGNIFLDVEMTLAPCIIDLLKSDMKFQDLPLLKLCLSGIVNTMNQGQFSRVRPYIKSINYQERIDLVVARFLKHGISNDSAALFSRITTAIDKDATVGECLLLVHELQKPLLSANQFDAQQYRVLKIVEYLLDCLDTYSAGENEATVQRRFATILDHVFRGTKIKLAEDETTSSCTKTTQIFNNTVHGVGNAAASVGRKIDVLLKSSSNDAVELSSIEVKKASVGPALVIAQQCKNLCTNASILSFLCALDPRRETLRTVAAIDLVGSVGYVYLLTSVGSLFFAQQIGILSLPRSLRDFARFATSLNLLFGYKDFVLRLAEEAQSAFDHCQNMDAICEAITIDNTEAPRRQSIYITPTRHDAARCDG